MLSHFRLLPIGNDLKPLWRKGLLGWPLCASAKNLTCKWGCLEDVSGTGEVKFEGVCARTGCG